METDQEFKARTGMHLSWKHSKHWVHRAENLKSHTKKISEVLEK